MRDDQTLLTERLSELGLDARHEDLPVDATITPRTLARSSAPTIAAIDVGELPRIALDEDLRLITTLGEGGMGRVHLARQRSLDRDVAVKTLAPNAPDVAASALLGEARLTGSLEHPGVIPVHALGIADDEKPVLVMKRVAGVDLATLLADDGSSAWGGAKDRAARLLRGLEILSQVSRTVEFAHSRGVIHRDIKPENVMVGSFGEVYLLDWGVATRIGRSDAGDLEGLVGTPVFMAPEMAVGRPVDARTDVYLLGSLLHAILVGRPRHEGASIVEVLRAATLSAPFSYAPEVPEQLARLCNAATARDPATRPQSAAAFRAEIDDFLRNRSARALSDVAWQRLEALEALLQSAQADGAPADLAGAYRLLTEARFGFAQSLREHAGNTAATDGARRSIIASIELERRQEHVETAEALLRELDDPPADLVARLEALRTRVSGHRAERARLESMAHDADPTQQRGSRTALLFVLAACVGLTWLVVILTSEKPGSLPGQLRLTGQAGLTLVGMAIVWLALRQRTMTNAFNRRMGAFVVIAASAGFVNRLLSFLTDTPVATTLGQDLLSWAAVAAGGAVALTRRLWAACAILLVGCVMMKLHPNLVSFVVTVLACFGAIIWAFARASRDG